MSAEINVPPPSVCGERVGSKLLAGAQRPRACKSMVSSVAGLAHALVYIRPAAPLQMTQWQRCVSRRGRLV